MKSLEGNLMTFDYKLDEYRRWLKENVTLSDPFSPQALRRLTFHLLMGKNYRLLTESNTKGRLFTTFLWLSELQKEAKKEYGDNWIALLFDEIYSQKQKPKELNELLFWIMGITNKTAVNLGLKKKDFPDFIKDTIAFFNDLFSRIGKQEFRDDAWLLLMAGSATLNIRGSLKSKIGKQFERVFLKSLLTILGFVENETFWMNIGRDLEVQREADAEVESKRGRIRIEMGLIASGNQEVIEDKIARVGRNGVILFDILGSKSRVFQSAENHGVKLVQIRNCDPLLEVYRHLKQLVKFELNKIPQTSDAMKNAVDELPEKFFLINQ